MQPPPELKPRPPGRPRSTAPRSDAERQAAYKQRLEEAKLKKVAVLVPEEDVERLKAYAADLRSQRGMKLPGEA